MRYNRKACLRALAVAKFDATRLPFGLAFNYPDQLSERRIGVRKSFGLDDAISVAFAPVWVTGWSIPLSAYTCSYSLLPGLKPRSLKKHELRKQARDLRRMKQYG